MVRRMWIARSTFHLVYNSSHLLRTFSSIGDPVTDLFPSTSVVLSSMHLVSHLVESMRKKEHPRFYKTARETARISWKIKAILFPGENASCETILLFYLTPRTHARAHFSSAFIKRELQIFHSIFDEILSGAKLIVIHLKIATHVAASLHWFRLPSFFISLATWILLFLT